MKPLVIAATWVSNLNLLSCMNIHVKICAFMAQSLSAWSTTYLTTCFNTLTSNIRCYNTRYTAKKNIYKMRVQTNVGKQPFMAMGHLEGPSNSFKKNECVCISKEIYTLSTCTVRTTNEINFCLTDEATYCTLYNAVQSHVNKFFLLDFFSHLTVFLLILPATSNCSWS